jgi:uncharacterized protein (TIGR02246 family)
MNVRAGVLRLVLSGLLAAAAGPLLAAEQEEAQVAAVRKSAERLATVFNAGKVDELAAMFLPQGEVISEDGEVYHGEKEIKELLNSFFTRFPETKLTVQIESIRLVGPVAIEEGMRTMTAKDGATKSQFRYIAVWTKSASDWKLASIRDFAEEPAATPNEKLQPLAWLVGDWLNEGADGKVAINYRWSDDKNYLLGDFQISSSDGTTTKSSQRIGWDPQAGKIRFWLFDADGGFAEGLWTILDGESVVKSTSVNPDGVVSSATMTITPKDKDHFSFKGTERIVGDSREPDFDLTVTRRPPTAGK